MMILRTRDVGVPTMMKRLAVAAALLIGTMLVSCGGGGGGGDGNDDDVPEASFEITDLGWVIENIDMNFWSAPPSAQSSCFYSFWIKYEGDDPAIADINTIRFYIGDTDRYWSYPLDEEDLFHPERNSIGKWYRFLYSEDSNIVPIGNITAEIEMKNGTVHEYTQSIPAPANDATTGFAYTYTEDYTGAIPGSYAPMVKRATQISGTKDEVNETLMINFTANDALAFSGYIRFYDDTDYIGYSDYLVDYETGDGGAILNGGAGLFTDGTVNTVDISAADITFEDNHAFGDITRFVIVLSDGGQYADDPNINTYDCLSRTGKISF